MLRNAAKTILSQLGLLKAGRVTYSFVKGLTPAVLFSEIIDRARGTSKGIPLPPERMMFLVIGTRWSRIFLESGERIVADMVENLKKSNLSLSAFKHVLDFGCGCGRLLRHLPKYTSATLCGTDYNETLIEWDKHYLKFAEFSVNRLAPPLAYASGAFDFIYARSVFTHLDKDLQQAWMKEMLRVLEPGGVLYFTTHGELFHHLLSSEEKSRVLQGELVVLYPKDQGHNICSSFESPHYVKEHLSEGFKILQFIPGKVQQHLQQDTYIFQKL